MLTPNNRTKKHQQQIGRRKPYTAIGISRVPCARCGKPARFQWQCCANANRWLGVCEDCDIALNGLVIRFFRFDDAKQRLARYVDSIKR